MPRTWPEDWEARKAGEGCPFCEQGRVDSNEYGARFLAGHRTDAYLQRRGPAPGYSIVVFRDRHAADLAELTDAELGGFWREVRAAARLISAEFEPTLLNYQVLGNAVPHVHCHIVPRYVDDPSPNAPLAFEDREVPPDEFDRRLRALRSEERAIGGPVTHQGLTADMFVIRDGRFLVLTRRGGLGEGVEYLLGGLVEAGEDPMAAAIRETKEETGLGVRDVSLLRTWTYATPEGWDTIHATYVGYSDDGDVSITDEHGAYRWIEPDEYVERWCSERNEEAFPSFAGWFRSVRQNCDLVRERLRA